MKTLINRLKQQGMTFKDLQIKPYNYAISNQHWMSNKYKIALKQLVSQKKIEIDNLFVGKEVLIQTQEWMENDTLYIRAITDIDILIWDQKKDYYYFIEVKKSRNSGKKYRANKQIEKLQGIFKKRGMNYYKAFIKTFEFIEVI